MGRAREGIRFDVQKGASMKSSLKRRGRSWLVGSVILACVSLVAAACGSSNQTATNTATKTGTKSAASQKPLTNVTLTWAAYAGNYGPFFTALDRGYYKAAGFNVKLIKASGATAIPGLISGSVTFAAAAASAPPAILKGYKVKVIVTNVSSPPYLIVAKKSITSLSQLAGGELGIQKKGDSTDFAAQQYLRSHGVDPSKVTFIPVGYDAERLAALEGGSVPAVILSPQDLVTLQQNGKAANFRILANLQGSIQFPLNGLVVSDSLLTKNPGEVRRFLQATAKGEEYFLTHKSYAVALLARGAKESTAAATGDYEDTGTWPTCGCIPASLQTQVIADYASSVKAQPVSASSVYDFSIAKQVYPAEITSGTNGSIVKNTLPTTGVLTVGG